MEKMGSYRLLPHLRRRSRRRLRLVVVVVFRRRRHRLLPPHLRRRSRRRLRRFFGANFAPRPAPANRNQLYLTDCNRQLGNLVAIIGGYASC